MELLLILLVFPIIIYLIVNYRRNSDPLNRKTASEICRSVVEHEFVDHDLVEKIFRENARYQKQASHVASMIPKLLQINGCPRDLSLTIAMEVKQIAQKMPK
jgi:hypothetical protein